MEEVQNEILEKFRDQFKGKVLKVFKIEVLGILGKVPKESPETPEGKLHSNICVEPFGSTVKEYLKKYRANPYQL